MMKLSSRLSDEELFSEMEKLAFLGRAVAGASRMFGRKAAPKAAPRYRNFQVPDSQPHLLARPPGRQPQAPASPTDSVRKSPWARMKGFGRKAATTVGVVGGVGGSAYGYTQFTGRNMGSNNPNQGQPYYDPSSNQFVNPQTGMPLHPQEAQAMGLY